MDVGMRGMSNVRHCISFSPVLVKVISGKLFLSLAVYNLYGVIVGS